MADVSWLRITFLVVGLLGLVPMTFLFGLYGLLAGLLFVFLAALAK